MYMQSESATGRSAEGGGGESGCVFVFVCVCVREREREHVLLVVRPSVGFEGLPLASASASVCTATKGNVWRKECGCLGSAGLCAWCLYSLCHMATPAGRVRPGLGQVRLSVCNTCPLVHPRTVLESISLTVVWSEDLGVQRTGSNYK
jgi:hypothetical protein